MVIIYISFFSEIGKCFSLFGHGFPRFYKGKDRLIENDTINNMLISISTFLALLL